MMIDSTIINDTRAVYIGHANESTQVEYIGHPQLKIANFSLNFTHSLFDTIYLDNNIIVNFHNWGAGYLGGAAQVVFTTKSATEMRDLSPPHVEYAKRWISQVGRFYSFPAAIGVVIIIHRHQQLSLLVDTVDLMYVCAYRTD